MVQILKNWLINQGVTEGLAGYVGWLGVALGVIILAFLSNYIAKRFLLAGVRYLVKKAGPNGMMPCWSAKSSRAFRTWPRRW